MNRMVKLTAFASALALAGLGAAQSEAAERSVVRECLTCVDGPGGGGQDQDFSGRRMRRIELPDAQPGLQNEQEPGVPSRRIRKLPQNDQVQQGLDDDDNIIVRKKARRTAHWRFDPNRHERRRKKDKRFRFFFEDYWYAEPYWSGGYYDDGPYGVSCREGADIVSERFNRVRIVECSGRVYTYLGRRHGDTFEVKLNPRTGRIIDAEEI